jgi:hypothetical protein
MVRPGRRLGCLTGAFVVLVLLVAIAVVADRLLLAAAEDEAQRRIDAAVDAADVRVEVTSLPFLPRLVADGQVERIEVESTTSQSPGSRSPRSSSASKESRSTGRKPGRDASSSRRSSGGRPGSCWAKTSCPSWSASPSASETAR